MSVAGTEDGHGSDDLPLREQLDNVASPTTGHQPHLGDEGDPLQRDDPWVRSSPHVRSVGSADETLPQGIPVFGRRRGQ